MSTDKLRDEHEQLQRAVLDSRRHAEAMPVSEFVREMRKVMDDYRDARAAGMSREDAEKGIESALRSLWPKPPSKFGPVCDDCDDTGWQEQTCSVVHRCGRQRCEQGPSSVEHTYVVACHCPRGDGPAGRTLASPVDQVSEATKSKPKKRGFSRFGS